MRETPVVINLISLLMTISMVMMMLPFRVLNSKVHEWKLFASEKDLRAHLYGDGHTTSQGAH